MTVILGLAALVPFILEHREDDFSPRQCLKDPPLVGGSKKHHTQLWVRERTLEKGKARLQSAGVEPDFNRDPVTRQPLAFSTAAPEPPPRPRRQGDGRFNSALP